jgi:hypothetical protein
MLIDLGDEAGQGNGGLFNGYPALGVCRCPVIDIDWMRKMA